MVLAFVDHAYDLTLYFDSYTKTTSLTAVVEAVSRNTDLLS